MTSAFGYAGQKCSAASRIIVVDRVYDELVDRLSAATAEVVLGHPSDMATQVGPVIDADAHDRLSTAIEKAAAEGAVLACARRRARRAAGTSVPTIVAVDDPDLADRARRSCSGRCWPCCEHAISTTRSSSANDTATRSPPDCSPGRRSTSTGPHASLRAGNVYLNRGTTGAVVGRQPFGGYGLSGVGSKAGGPDYLLQFLDPRVITENTVRQGFAGDE